MTETMTRYMLTKIEEAMDQYKEDFRIMGKEITSKRKYGEIKATYRLGCERCTAIGHSEDTCKNNKRPASSSADSNAAKKSLTG